MHRCAAPGCDLVIPLTRILCAAHLRQVPQADRRRYAAVVKKWQAAEVTHAELRAAERACVKAVGRNAKKGGAA
jgi:hypothetical protein